MSVMTVMPRTGEEWTVDDLDRLPDDGLQYELLHGLLLATPAPVLAHQRAVGNLHVLLRAACPPGYEHGHCRTQHPVPGRRRARRSRTSSPVSGSQVPVAGPHCEPLAHTTRRRGPARLATA